MRLFLFKLFFASLIIHESGLNFLDIEHNFWELSYQTTSCFTR